MGAAGFIGTNLACALVDSEKSNEFKELVLVDEEIDYFKFCPVRENKWIKIIEKKFDYSCDFGDVLDEGDLVFHLISTNNPYSSNKNISDEITANISISIKLLEACVLKNISKVVFISSGGTIYGDVCCPIPESAENNPITTYGIQKLAIEKLLYLYNYMYGLDYRVARLSNPYGPYQRPNGRLGAVTTFTDRALHDKELIVYGDGGTIRDYIYIDDAINAILNISFNECKYRIYNVGSGKGTDLNSVIKHIKSVANKELSIRFKKRRNVDLDKNFLDVSRYEEEFGKINRVDLEEGIRRTAEYLSAKYV